MDAMKEALRRKVLEMKGQGGQGLMAECEDEEKKGSDLAPSIGGEGGDGLAQGDVPAIDPEILAQIVAALADHDPGAGREPSGLQERAAIGAKEKLKGLRK